MRRTRKVLLAVTVVAGAVLAIAGPASAAVFSCDMGGLAVLEVDIPITAEGPAAVAVGETNNYKISLELGGAIPEEFSSLSGTANSGVASLVVPPGVEVDPATLVISGLDGATGTVNGNKVEIDIPGPIPFGGGATLPDLTVSVDVKATQAGEFVLTTEGATAILEAEAAITEGSTPIALTVECTAGTPENVIVVTASEVASATQTAAPAATQPAAPTEASTDLATTGSESTILSGVALILMGVGMLAVAGQRVVAYRRD